MNTRTPGRLALLSVTAATLAGCSPRADVDRTVRLPRDQVYLAFAAAIPPSGTETVPDFRGPGDEMGELTTRIRKHFGQSIEISSEFDKTRLFHVRLQFDSLYNGAATRVRGDVDFAQIIYPRGLGPSPQAETRMIERALNHAIDQIAAGRPLTALAMSQRRRNTPVPYYDYGESTAF